jgi:hypothetical protein
VNFDCGRELAVSGYDPLEFSFSLEIDAAAGVLDFVVAAIKEDIGRLVLPRSPHGRTVPTR